MRKAMVFTAAAAFTLALPAHAQSPAATKGDHAREVSRLYDQADAALATGKLEEALRLTKQALQLDPRNEKLHNELGLAYTQQKKLPEAIQSFRAALKLNPNYAPSLMNLGLVLYGKHAYTEAIDCFNKYLQLEGDNKADTLLCLANSYRDRASSTPRKLEREADYHRALEFYKEAAAENPSYANIHNHLGVFYFQKNELQLAEDEIRRAIELKKDYAAAYYNLALVESKLHKQPEAAAAWKDALRFENDPSYKQVVRKKLEKEGIPTADNDYLSRSYDLLSESQWQAAETLLKRAIESDAASDPIAHNNLGYAQAKQEKLQEAVSSYKQAISLSEGSFPSAEYNLGQALRMLGDLPQAEHFLRKAAADEGGMNAMAHNALGLVYKRQKKFEQALSEYKLSIMQSGDTIPVVHYNLAMLLESQSGRKDDAVEEYKLYLKQAPQGANAESAKARLAALEK